MIHRQKPFRCQALPVLILTNSEFPEMDVIHLGSIRPVSREQQKPTLSCRYIVLFQSFSQFTLANSFAKQILYKLNSFQTLLAELQE